MPTIPSIGKKKAITKKEADKSYYTLNNAFDLIGKKVNGESWEQLKDCHTSCGLIDVLSGLIKNNFCDLFNQNDAINKLSYSQKSALLNNDVNYQSFAHKIATKDKNVVVAGKLISVPSTKLTNAIKKSFYEKYNPDPKIKYKPTKIKKADEIILPTILDNEPDKINYNFPTNFLIPKEQFDYVLKTGRRWIDREPSKEYQGMVISECYTNFHFVEPDFPMMFVGDKSNLISYFELKNFLKEKFIGTTEYDIDFWLDYEQPSIAALEKNISSDGYVKFTANVVVGSRRNYKAAFYHKKQVENFIPKHFFIDYGALLEKWRKEFGINEGEAESLLLRYLSLREVMSLFDIKRTDRLITHPPRHKDYLKALDNYFDDINKLNEQDKINFIKECFFEKLYIEKIEEEHLKSSLSAQSNKQLTNKHHHEIPPQIQKILANSYHNFLNYGNLKGWETFRDEWDFDEIPNNNYHIDRSQELPFFTYFYYNNIQFNHLENIDDEFYHFDSLTPFKKHNFREKEFIYLADLIAYTLLLSIISEQKGFKNIYSIPEDYLKELDRDCFHFTTGRTFIKSVGLYKLGFLNKELVIDDAIFNFAQKLTESHPYYDEYRKTFLSIEKSTVKNLYDLLIKHTRDLNDPIVRVINHHIKSISTGRYIPEIQTAGQTFDDLFEVHYNKIQRFIAIKTSIYRALKNGELALFEKGENGYFQKLEIFDEAKIKQNHELFDGKINGKTIYIANDIKLAAKQSHTRTNMVDEPLQIQEEKVVNDGINPIVSEQDDVIRTAGREPSVDYSKIFQALFGILNKASFFTPPQQKHSKQIYISAQSKKVAETFNSLTIPEKTSIQKLMRPNGKLMCSRVKSKLTNKGIKIASKKNGGDINKSELEQIINKINNFIK